MAASNPSRPSFPSLRPSPALLPRLPLFLVGTALLLIALVGGYIWFIQRVEVEAGEVLVLIRKVGQPLPDTAPDGSPLPAELRTQVVLYPELLQRLGQPPNSTRYKGIQYDVLTEGRYFRDPFFWERKVIPAISIAQDEVGLLIRKFGRSLPSGKLVATEPDERGPLAEVLKPGRYNINPHAYDVRRVRPVIILAGQVGIQTLLSGADPTSPNEYVVRAGERGVQPDVLPPGMYYNNPYLRRIQTMDVRSQTLDLHGQDCIRFPSNDSFEILIDCTVEYAIRQDMAPHVVVAIGDHADVRDKLILPYTRSLCRIEGSKLPARDFIAGETRTAFQQQVFEGLRNQCYAQGIEIRATLIRRIVPPPEIAGPISDRQVAGQQIKQYENEIKLAEAEARLVEQEELQKQNQAIGQASREVVTIKTQAEQTRTVAVTEANQRLEVARLALEAARQKALALLARGQADAEVVLLQYRAEADPLQEAVTAFGGGEMYAQYFFYQKLAPALKSVLASTDGPFADIFRALTPARPVPPGSAPAHATAGGASPAAPAPTSTGGAQ
jgi:regulator of protease activity HflC (stomatin/prohibitin superfamily)